MSKAGENTDMKGVKKFQNGTATPSSIEQYSAHWTSVMSTVFRAILEKLNPAVINDSKVLTFCQPFDLMVRIRMTVK